VSGIRGAALLQRSIGSIGSIGHRLAVQSHPSGLVGNSTSAAAIAAAALARQQQSLSSLSAAANAAAGLHGPL